MERVKTVPGRRAAVLTDAPRIRADEERRAAILALRGQAELAGRRGEDLHVGDRQRLRWTRRGRTAEAILGARSLDGGGRQWLVDDSVAWDGAQVIVQHFESS